MTSTTPLTLDDLHHALGGRLAPTTSARSQAVGPVVTDSREVRPGDVFWALRGAAHDGADFVGEAFARGATGVVTHGPIDPPEGRWALVVDNTQQALWQWAAAHRRRFTGILIAVTGSVGKTTARQMIHTVLGSRLSGTASPRNYNNHVGVPLSMLALEPSHDYAVLELGASGPSEIAALAGLCRPKVGVITHVADAHLGGFGSRAAIARAKAELLDALPPDGHAVLVDEPRIRQLAAGSRAPVTWVGRNESCDVVGENVTSQHGQLSFRCQGQAFLVPVWGRHHLDAALLAVAVGRLFGMDLHTIAKALAQFAPLPMRCEVTEVRGAMLINDAYNASPAAMRAALELLRDFDVPGRRVVVAGDMAELGEESECLHHVLGTQMVELGGADLVIACGQFARAVVEGARAAGMPAGRTIPCRTAEDALPYLGQAILPGDAVLVKGSRVMNMETIVEALRRYPQRRSA